VTLHPLLALAAVAALAGCAAAPGALPSRGDSATCVGLFQWFDTIAATMSTPSGQNDRRVIPMQLELPAQRLRSAGCITMSADLAGMSTAGGIAASPGGPAIAPVLLHVGVVTNMEDDAAARAFFAANGVPARSIGSSALGRRIYLGPFGTEGDLDVARDLAVRGGFAFPYTTGRML
jgi:hypothetical protein